MPSELPGVRERPSRFVPRLHYELLACGVAGHRLIGLDVRDLREDDDLLAFERDGQRWHRCLRCDSWLPLAEPTTPTRDHLPARDEIELPLRGRPLRDKVILRLIAVNRLVHFLVLGLVGAAILAFRANKSDLQGKAYKVIADLQGGVGTSGQHGHGLAKTLDRLFSLESGKLQLFAAVALVYATVELVEAVGLWYAKRWAEYLTLLVTASLLPVEVYELSHRFTPLKTLTFVINVAVVVYLLLAKRLFGLRGGARAEKREREADVGWEALERNAPPITA